MLSRDVTLLVNSNAARERRAAGYTARQEVLAMLSILTKLTLPGTSSYCVCPVNSRSHLRSRITYRITTEHSSRKIGVQS